MRSVHPQPILQLRLQELLPPPPHPICLKILPTRHTPKPHPLLSDQLLPFSFNIPPEISSHCSLLSPSHTQSFKIPTPPRGKARPERSHAAPVDVFHLCARLACRLSVRALCRILNCQPPVARTVIARRGIGTRMRRLWWTARRGRLRRGGLSWSSGL